MLTFILVFGLVIVGVGIFGIGWPAQMTRMVGRVTFTNRLRYLAAAFRLALGAVLYLVAEQTGFPMTMKILAAFTVLAGVSVLFFSADRLQRWLETVRGWPPLAMRGVGLVALLLGGFFVLAVV
ncbi:MAG: hypothetical protein OXP09_05600 [Gammaproteobacteria bacterium]|nr:hypothetical protein [Gammaproteobacteria bacterium]